jgi:hypothetical protein
MNRPQLRRFDAINRPGPLIRSGEYIQAIDLAHVSLAQWRSK